MDANKTSYWLLKEVNRAIREYHMLKDGDRVAVAVSGGKDSLALLRLLSLRRQESRESYEIVAIHISGDSRGVAVQQHQPLIDWFQQNDVCYSILPLRLPVGETLPLNCHRCAWNRRRILFEEAHRLGCNIIAFGHHADDLAQTTLLNLLYHGKVETIAPVREYFNGSLRTIHPLCYLAEKDIRRFARASNFPEPPPACPQENLSRRKMVADFIRETGREQERVTTNLLKAGLRTMAEIND